MFLIIKAEICCLRLGVLLEQSTRVLELNVSEHQGVLRDSTKEGRRGV